MVTTIFLFHTSELADYTAIINQVVTFQPGDTEQFVLFNSSTDDVVEGTEMLTSFLSNPSTGVTLGNDTATIRITDVGGSNQHCCCNDAHVTILLQALTQHFHTIAAVVVEFDTTIYAVAESEGAVVMFRIVKRTMTTQPVSVLFSSTHTGRGTRMGAHGTALHVDRGWGRRGPHTVTPPEGNYSDTGRSTSPTQVHSRCC